MEAMTTELTIEETDALSAVSESNLDNGVTLFDFDQKSYVRRSNLCCEACRIKRNIPFDENDLRCLCAFVTWADDTDDNGSVAEICGMSFAKHETMLCEIASAKAPREFAREIADAFAAYADFDALCDVCKSGELLA